MKRILFFGILAFVVTVPAVAQEGDPVMLEKMAEWNAALADAGLAIEIHSIEYFTIGNGRPSNRIHQSTSRWVSGDVNRLAQGDDITYMIVPDGTASGVSAAATTAAIQDSMDTWQAQKAFGKVLLDERPYAGGDVTIFDFFLGFGGFGNPFAADIVSAGWFPPGLFDAAAGCLPGDGCGANILAFSVSFIFTSGGLPTDSNNDQYLDRALNEVYYNDSFNWGIDVPIPQVDVETVALHENGHSLGIGHFGPPPAASLNPVYAGIRQSPFPVDNAGMSTLWRRWPN